jgi:hypothetical protein
VAKLVFYSLIDASFFASVVAQDLPLGNKFEFWNNGDTLWSIVATFVPLLFYFQWK